MSPNQKALSLSLATPAPVLHPSAPRARCRWTFTGWAALTLLWAMAGCSAEPDPAALAGEVCDVQSQRAQRCPYEPFPVQREECVAAYQCQAYLYGEAYTRPFVECAAVACKTKGGPEQYEACIKEKFKVQWSTTERSGAQKDFEAACTTTLNACAGELSAPSMSRSNESCTSFPVQLRAAVFADLKACLGRPCGEIQDCFQAAQTKSPYCTLNK